MIDFLHYLIMFSQTNSGIKAKDFDSLRREFLLVGAKKGFPQDLRISAVADSSATGGIGVDSAPGRIEQLWHGAESHAFDSQRH